MPYPKEGVDEVTATETEIVVRYCETDQMGVAHHASYVVWFEAGRTDFLKKLGLKYSDVEKQGVLLPLIGLKCRFINPARYEDEIIVRTRLAEIGRVRIAFNYDVVIKEGMIHAASGETTHAWTDKSFKPLNIEKRMPELYSLLKGAL